MREYVPLSERSAQTIRIQSERYHQMAATARTAQVQRGLQDLARRFANLAMQREAEELTSLGQARPLVRRAS